MTIDDAKKVINKNQISEISLNEAKEFIKSILHIETDDEKLNSNLIIKCNLLQALRVVVSDEFNINPKQIKYKIYKLNKEGTTAQIETNRGDGVYRVGIEEDFFEKGSVLRLLIDSCHEFGHLKNYLEAKRGKKMPNSIHTDFSRLNENMWQKRGALYRYRANKDEFLANQFATSKVLKWIQESVKKKNISSQLFLNAEIVINKKIDDNIKFRMARLKYAGWKTLSKIRKIKDSGITYEYDISVDFFDKIANNTYVLRTDQEVYDEAKFYLGQTGTAGQDYILKDKSKNEKCEWMRKSISAMRIVLADELGISPNEVGFGYISDLETDSSFIDVKKYNPDNPLKIILAYNEEKINELEHLSDFVKQMKPAINNAIRNMAIKNNSINEKN